MRTVDDFCKTHDFVIPHFKYDEPVRRQPIIRRFSKQPPMYGYLQGWDTRIVDCGRDEDISDIIMVTSVSHSLHERALKTLGWYAVENTTVMLYNAHIVHHWLLEIRNQLTGGMISLMNPDGPQLTHRALFETEADAVVYTMALARGRN